MTTTRHDGRTVDTFLSELQAGAVDSDELELLENVVTRARADRDRAMGEAYLVKTMPSDDPAAPAVTTTNTDAKRGKGRKRKLRALLPGETIDKLDMRALKGFIGNDSIDGGLVGRGFAQGALAHVRAERASAATRTDAHEDPIEVARRRRDARSLMLGR